jgi:hypothetical protein
VPSRIRAQISPAQVHATTVVQSWLVPLETDWPKYLEGTMRKLEPAFRCPEPGPGEMTCTWAMAGDYLTLTLTPIETESGRSVQV